MSTAETTTERHGLLTIGTVCGLLKDDFPDISISKIRYLEDQGLLAPRRTQGGYRLFSDRDVERLRRILELQRDEFLPLRVIREELASPTERKRRQGRPKITIREDELDLDALCERAAISPELARELEEYGLLEPRTEGGERLYAEGDAEIALVCGKLANFGISPRHLRTFRTASDREAGLLEALIAPSLRSRNPDRREAGLKDLQVLAEAAQELSQLLFWRQLRQLAAR
jgi:DNA-binding transcriptional MerR regulator